MTIVQKNVIPTGYLFTSQCERGELETLSIGDYGKRYNIKADFLGFPDEIAGVPNIPTMPLSEKWVVTLSTQYGCPQKCTFCFPKGTMIQLSNGNLVPIESIKVGDVVQSFDETTNGFITSEVSALFSQPYKGKLISIELEDGSILNMTPDHPVLIKQGDKKNVWVLAKDLKDGMEVVKYIT